MRLFLTNQFRTNRLSVFPFIYLLYHTSIPISNIIWLLCTEKSPPLYSMILWTFGFSNLLWFSSIIYAFFTKYTPFCYLVQKTTPLFIPWYAYIIKYLICRCWSDIRYIRRWTLWRIWYYKYFLCEKYNTLLSCTENNALLYNMICLHYQIFER